MVPRENQSPIGDMSLDARCSFTRQGGLRPGDRPTLASASGSHRGAGNVAGAAQSVMGGCKI